MPNSNPVCTTANFCKCESEGIDYPVPDTLTLDWDATIHSGSSTGSVALVRHLELCRWRGVHELICEIDGKIFTRQYVFELETDAPNGNESCGWFVSIIQGFSETPNATPNSSSCMDEPLSALSDYNQANPWHETTCACDPVDLTFYATGSEDDTFFIAVTD